jgi:hypothetical protein
VVGRKFLSGPKRSRNEDVVPYEEEEEEKEEDCVISRETEVSEELVATIFRL